MLAQVAVSDLNEMNTVQIIKMFENAKRTIAKCLHYGGLNLPNDSFDEWRRIEVTFDPSLTRQR